MISRRDFVKKSAITGAILSMGGITTGFACNAQQWISIALADLPTILQMALSIAQLAGALNGGDITAAETAAITEISTEASKDLTLIQSLYNQYKQNPSAGILDALQKAIADVSTNLPGLLAALHLKDTILQARIAAAVNLILTTVASFASLIPQPTNPVVAEMKRKAKGSRIPKAADLVKAWNQQVCAPTGNQEVDTALNNVVMK